MSRVEEYDDEDAIPYGLWQRAQFVAFNSARGQTALDELERALLALPTKRLIANHLARDGAVCIVGAYVWRQRVRAGADPVKAMEQMSCDVLVQAPASGYPALEDEDSCGLGPWHTEEEGRKAGLRRTVVAGLMEHNDETWAGLTPEARYDIALAWVRKMRSDRPLPPEPMIVVGIEIDG